MGKIPHVKDLTGIDLSTLDKEELLQAALSYKRAYYTAKKNNVAWKNRQFAARRWYENNFITNNLFKKFVLKSVSHCPLYDDLHNYMPEKFEDGKYYRPEEYDWRYQK